jgi:uncharacterized protein
LPNFGIFRKRKQAEVKETTEAPETSVDNPAPCENKAPEVSESNVVDAAVVDESQASEAEVKEEEVKVSETKTYLKALPLRDLADLDAVKKEINCGNILILRITPLAAKSIEDVKVAVNDLSQFAESIGGDIARLGEERVVLTPPKIRIWREKTQVAAEPLSTAA